MLSNDIDILNIANKWKNLGKKVAIATVIQTWGSAPRGVGSKLVIDQDGNFEGSVSGGCVEGAVINEAMELFEDSEPKVLEYGVSNEMAWEVGLACGGTIRIYLNELK
ncbi:MAG: XdhC family protein [Hyphomicrobiales bacterium]|jgi:xanthine/CO dehydrogenase XdhC/CoxF family maturation factor|nr:XdhC family protein [Hyphomicrobiales bacterium]|tara:strand:+ start:882 stop:1205 length:324 start_codon:yes stop_codon:yes gene_type:complete